MLTKFHFFIPDCHQPWNCWNCFLILWVEVANESFGRKKFKFNFSSKITLYFIFYSIDWLKGFCGGSHGAKKKFKHMDILRVHKIFPQPREIPHHLNMLKMQIKEGTNIRGRKPSESPTSTFKPLIPPGASSSQNPPKHQSWAIPSQYQNTQSSLSSSVSICFSKNNPRVIDWFS